MNARDRRLQNVTAFPISVCTDFLRRTGTQLDGALYRRRFIPAYPPSGHELGLLPLAVHFPETPLSYPVPIATDTGSR